MRHPIPVILKDERVVWVAQITMDEVDQIDAYLSRLPRPPVDDSEIDALRERVKAVVDPIADRLANLSPAMSEIEREGQMVNIRRQLAVRAGEKLEDLYAAQQDWPPQFYGGGMDFVTRDGKGRLFLLGVMLRSGRPDMADAEVQALYRSMYPPDFLRITGAFVSGDDPDAKADDEEDADPKGGDGDTEAPATTGQSSTTGSPQPTAGRRKKSAD